MRTARSFVILGMALLLTAAATWSDACALSCGFTRASTACHAPGIGSARASAAQIGDHCMQHHHSTVLASLHTPSSTATPIMQHPCQHDLVSSEPEASSSRVLVDTASVGLLTSVVAAKSTQIGPPSQRQIQPSPPAFFDPIISSLRI